MKPIKSILRFLEVPDAEQRRLIRHREEAMREAGIRITTPWHYLPRYQKLLLILALGAIIALAILGFLHASTSETPE